MTLWLVFALMTAAAVFAVLWPLSRRDGSTGGSDVAVYKDQLHEIARDRAAGLIGEAEAEAAKVEVSRRLLAAADAAKAVAPARAGESDWRRRATAIAGLVLVPLAATALYLVLGSPQMPGAPLAERARVAHPDTSIASLVSQVESHLEKNPDDPRGYEVLAPVYLRMGRMNDAVAAQRRLIALAGENAARQADLGEALTAQANGIVTAEAKAAFDRALTLDPKDAKATFFTGMAAEQDGKRDEAAAIWRGLLETAPPDAPWVDTVREALARVGGTPPVVAQAAPPAIGPPVGAGAGPTAADIAAARGMSEEDRSAMVRGMVERLADRLKQNSDDVEGWQRLLRAYIVLGDRDKAKGAATDARRALASDPDKLRRIDDTIKSMGLEG